MTTVVKGSYSGSLTSLAYSGLFSTALSTSAIPLLQIGSISTSIFAAQVVWYAPFSGYIDTIQALLSVSGSTTNTGTCTAYIQTGGVGSFSATTAATTPIVFGAGLVNSLAQYNNASNSPVIFNAGDGISLYLQASAGTSSCNCVAYMGVRIQ